MKPEKIMRKSDGEMFNRNEDGTYSLEKTGMAKPYKYSYEELIEFHKDKFVALWDGEPNGKIELEDMVDIQAGKMRLGHITEEIRRYTFEYKPDRMIVDIKTIEDGFHATIYIPVKNFKHEK